jgi:hypothetical protein
MPRRLIALLVAFPVLLSAGPASTQRGPSTNRAEPQFRVEAAADVLAAIKERAAASTSAQNGRSSRRRVGQNACSWPNSM